MKTTAADKVFRALADPSRRRILDLVKASPGVTVSELAGSFDFTRYAVMKHLRILEDVGLIVPRRAGKTKELYLNAIPIQTIYDRWISRYSALWASQLTSLKYKLEKEEPTMGTKPQHLYVLYIGASTDKVWDALTNPELTVQYFHSTEIQSEFKAGSVIDYMVDDKEGGKRSVVSGKILEVDPGKRVMYTFKFEGNDDPPSTVTYEIEEAGEMSKLTVSHVFETENQTYKDTGEGWPAILSSLKSLLETGTALPMPPC